MIKTYNKTVGSTWSSEAGAAERAYYGTGAIFNPGPGPGSKVNYDLTTLNSDFMNLFNAAMGQASPAYEEQAATTDTDIQQFAADCSS